VSCHLYDTVDIFKHRSKKVDSSKMLPSRLVRKQNNLNSRAPCCLCVSAPTFIDSNMAAVREFVAEAILVPFIAVR
jgi:hypothetical protein